MTTTLDNVLYWVRREIPAYLDTMGNAETFIARYNQDCASYYWYQFAVEVAILRWPKHREKLEALRDLR